MTPVKLTSVDIDSPEVVVMFDKITYLEKTKTSLGTETTRIHMGDDSVEVRETIEEVFHGLARALHGVDDAPPDGEVEFDPSEDTRLPNMTRIELISYLTQIEAEESND